MSILRLLSPMILAFAFVVPAHAAKGVHVWYDENGQAVYSQFAPPDDRQSRKIAPPPPPAEAPETARQRLQDQLQQLDDNREDEAIAQEKNEEVQTKAATAQQRCETARRNREALERGAGKRMQNPDGSMTRMTEEDRQKRLAEMDKVITEECR